MRGCPLRDAYSAVEIHGHVSKSWHIDVILFLVLSVLVAEVVSTTRVFLAWMVAVQPVVPNNADGVTNPAASRSCGGSYSHSMSST